MDRGILDLFLGRPDLRDLYRHRHLGARRIHRRVLCRRQGVHPVANGMATAADWMSAASFISMAGLIAFNGYGGSVYLMGWTGGYVLLALLLAPTCASSASSPCRTLWATATTRPRPA
jgi:hypothetical protein